MGLAETTAFLTDLFARRGEPAVGFNPPRFVELYGGQLVDCLAYEPDAVTFRRLYYYNTTANVLYKKVVTDVDRHTSVSRAHWRSVSTQS